MTPWGLPIFVNNMDLKSIEELRSDWEHLLDQIGNHFGMEPDLQGILFIIGVQELGQGNLKFTKDQKQDLMHIATCRLMSTYGHYRLEGVDDEGWPHWKLVEKLPVLSLKEQDYLLKKAIVIYFRDIFPPRLTPI
jgi:hypothetical protein